MTPLVSRSCTLCLLVAVALTAAQEATYADVDDPGPRALRNACHPAQSAAHIHCPSSHIF